MLGKRSSGRRAKKRFLYSHEYRDQKKGGKNARYTFSRNTRIVRGKMLGKRSSGKRANKRFFIFTRISLPKKRGEKRVKQFCQQHPNSASIKCWGKNRRKKVRKHVFYIHTNIVTKKVGGKTRGTILPAKPF